MNTNKSSSKKRAPRTRTRGKKANAEYVMPFKRFGLTRCSLPGCIAPDFLRVTLPFMERNTISLATPGVGGTLQYRGNSVFDPNFTGIGTDCNGFTEWTAFYTKYRVRASRMIATVIANTFINNENVSIGLTAYPDTTAINVAVSLDDVIGSTFGKGAMSNIYTSGSTLDTSLRTTDVLGLLPLAVEIDDTLASATTTNPSKQWMWQLSALCNVTGNVDVDVKIYYDVEFFNRKQTTA